MFSKNENGSSFLASLAYVAGFILLIFIAYLTIKETNRKNQVQKMINDLNSEAERIEREKADIADRISYFESSDFQKKELKDKFNMQEPGENVVIVKPSIVKEAAEDSAKPSFPEQELATPNPIKWWNHFFKY